MSYRRDKQKFPKGKVLSGLLVLFIAYVIFGTSAGDVLHKGLERVSIPLWRAEGESMFSAGIIGAFQSKLKLTAENEKLKKELRDLGLKLLDRNLLYEENLLLKEKVGRGNIDESIFARVLTRPGQSLYDTLIIDVGSEVGLRGGERVMYEDTILIGSIAEVGEKTSKVKLFSTFGEEISVEIGENMVSAIATGHGSENFEIKVPRETPVKEGDVILAPSLMPHMLGTVEHIESKPNDPFERILFKSPVPLFEINYVVVLLGK